MGKVFKWKNISNLGLSRSPDPTRPDLKLAPPDNKMSSLSQARMEVEQLRREAAIKRIPVSQVVEDIKRFAMDHMMQDHLIVGFASEKANPFREKTWSCEVL